MRVKTLYNFNTTNVEAVYDNDNGFDLLLVSVFVNSMAVF